MVIRGVLKEELINAYDMRKNYARAIESVPGGSIVKKPISGKYYYYLAVRKGNKVEFKYIKPDNLKSFRKNLVKERAMRHKYKELAKQVEIKIKFLERALRGKAKV